VAQRHRFARTRLFLGIGHDLEDTLQPEHADAFDFLAYCASGSNRALAKAGVLDILPSHYSDFPALVRSGALRVDVLMLQLSPPDKLGRFSLGMAREYLVPALDSARTVLAEVSATAPWTHGGPYLHESDIDLLVENDADPALPEAAQPGLAERAIGRHIAKLVDDAATLQTGIGTVPDAVLAELRHHRHLGVHSGSLGDGIAALAESGALTNSRKTIDQGVTIGGVLIGGERLRRFAHQNPGLELRSTEYTHDARVLSGIDRFVAVNSALEVDVTGQVNSEAARGAYVGAVGGILDFLGAAHRSKGGIPIVALPSTAGSHSRIVASLSGPVTVPRSYPCVIVTEHGVADLRGKSLSQRIGLMMAIAHPDHRESLEREVRGMRACGWKSPWQAA